MVLSALRLARRVPPIVWFALVSALVMPLYLRYFAWAMGSCGMALWTPIR